VGLPDGHFDSRIAGLVEHAIQYGLDKEYGGVFRDGPHAGPAYVTDKEWWQHCEALVGFLDAYLHTGDEACFEAFLSTWSFSKQHLIDPVQGEWRQLVGRCGEPICMDLGNPWKAIYHTGRAMHECLRRLDLLMDAPRA
jgi:mannobiose 2-epimerase